MLMVGMVGNSSFYNGLKKVKYIFPILGMFHLAFKHGTSDEKYLGVDSTGNTPLLKLKQVIYGLWRHLDLFYIIETLN